MSKSVYRSTSHVCNASLKKISEKTVNDFSKHKTNNSFWSSSNFPIILEMFLNKKGFSATGFSSSDCNQFYRTSYAKQKLEPLSEKNLDRLSKDFKDEEELLHQEELSITKIDCLNDNRNNNLESI